MRMETSPTKLRPARSAGLLLHPSSLPGPYGIGDLGPAAYAWVDALVRAGQSWWQILPLGPTGYGDSPYQCFSAFAGNPYLISPDLLVRDGLVKAADLTGTPLPAAYVDYGPVIAFKLRLLARAWQNFQADARSPLGPLFETYCQEQAAWLDDFAVFMALKDAHGGVSWLEWPQELIERDLAALTRARGQLRENIGLHKFSQFLFARQWQDLRRYANRQGVRLIGDIPIFISSDSADVWSNPGLFLLNPRRRPLAVAGVPPDYFSATGQLWGNPLYNWPALKQTGYAWWAARLRSTLEQVDLVRLDHFRGFEAYWQVPAGQPTAEKGSWVKGPGADLLETLQKALGGLPLIAEDLGVITPEVDGLRCRFQLPGMRILQFGFGGAIEARFLPHNYEPHTVVYTGTHDNNTTRGWYEALTEAEARFLHRYVPESARDPSWSLLRVAWASVADYALAPLQDVLGLGAAARMNLPGRASGNWRWRFTEGMLTEAVIERLADLTDVYDRMNPKSPSRSERMRPNADQADPRSAAGVEP
jgi:4-alpha-glucanotransferase